MGASGSSGATGTGGTNGAGGTTGTGGASGGTSGTGGATGGSGGAPPTGGFYCNYKVEEKGNATAIGSELWIVNNSGSSVALNTLKLRYYLTNEVTMSILQRINWGNAQALAGGAADQIQGEITITPPTRLPTAAPGADSYVEFGFNSNRMLQNGWRVQFSWTVHNLSLIHI